MTTAAGLPDALPRRSPPLWLNTLDDVLKHVSLAARTAVAVPFLIENSQLRPPSLIVDAPLKLWLKQLDLEVLEVLYNKLVANLLRDNHDIPQTNNLKPNIAAYVLKRRNQGRETYSPTGENSVGP